MTVSTAHPGEGPFRGTLRLNDYDPTQCLMEEGNPCEACRELAELDADIHDLSKTLAQKRRIVKEKINHLHDPLIRHLPVELVSRVFLFWVKGMKQPFLGDYSSKFSEVECSAPLVISAVCRDWREVAFGTPQLWTTANIYLYSPEKILLQQELTRQWFYRSGQLPLEISLFCPDEGSRFNHTSLSPFFDAVKTYVQRWQILKLILSPVFYATFIGDLTCAPSLEGLQLRPRSEDDGRLLAFSLPETPVLGHLRVNYLLISNLTFQWNTLTIFEMNNISMDEIFEVLRRAGKLEKCVFTDVCSYGLDCPLPTKPITHLSLKDLELELRPNINEEVLFDYLVLPALERFVYDASRSDFFDPIAADKLVPFLTQSQCMIKTFKIEGPDVYITDNELIRILAHLPSVTQLSLNSFGFSDSTTWITDELFRRFQVNAESSTGNFDFLPHLEDLEISGPRRFSWECFLETLNSLVSHIQPSSAFRNPPNANALSALCIPDAHAERSSINVCLNLGRLTDTYDYVDLNVLPRLANVEAISLQILDGVDGTDLIRASMLHHGLTSSNAIDQATS